MKSKKWTPMVNYSANLVVLSIKPCIVSPITNLSHHGWCSQSDWTNNGHWPVMLANGLRTQAAWAKISKEKDLHLSQRMGRRYLPHSHISSKKNI